MEDVPENYFVDPFGPFEIKIICTIAYILMLPGCCIAICFIWYERSGNAGPYRTCINQLVSGIYFMVSIVFLNHTKSILYRMILKLQCTFYFTVCGLADLVRAWYGPMPNFICAPIQVTRHTIHMMLAIHWTVVALLKVWIVCIHKSVPSIDDDFIAAFVTRASFMMSFLFAIVSKIIPQKPAIAYVSFH